MSLQDVATVADTARILKLNIQMVRNWIADGSLPAMRVGRRARGQGIVGQESGLSACVIGERRGAPCWAISIVTRGCLGGSLLSDQAASSSLG